MSVGEFGGAEFALRWKWHLRRRFGRPGAVADEFRVAHRTAERWFAAESAPSAAVLFLYLLRSPEARADLFGGRDARG